MISPKQKEVLENCKQQLSEHFEAHSVNVFVADAAGDHCDLTLGHFNGGRTLVMGLLLGALAELTIKHLKDSVEYDDGDDGDD